MISDLRSLADKIFYAPNNLRQNLFANLSLGKWDLAAGTLNNLRGWTDQDFANNPATFDNQSPYFPKASGMMSDEQFLAQCRANVIQHGIGLKELVIILMLIHLNLMILKVYIQVINLRSQIHMQHQQHYYLHRVLFVHLTR